MSKVCIIILNWNSWQDTTECIESLKHLNYNNYSIVVVDNGSTDGSEARLRKRFQGTGIHIIQSGANLGFAGGNNIGIRHGLTHNADYFWLLNNDTVVEPSTLSELLEALEHDEAIGMIGSKILYFDAPDTIWYAGAVLDPSAPHRSCHRGLNDIDQGQYDEASETGYITGCSLLVRRKVVEQIGLLEEEMFLYYEDTDWSARALRAGWKLYYAPASVVLHKASASLGGMESPKMTYYLARNLLYFVRRNYPEKLFSALAFNLFQNVAVKVKKGRWRAAGFGCRGIFDYFCGRLGQLR